ncbi:hypothetical protein BC835DRAFT_1349414 [Cytidiella melzeri]|nr:hypothetical protein BC835DRAFT_1349414 [Cytidiella melzeri]
MIHCKVCPGRIFVSTYAYDHHAKTSKAHSAKFSCTICQQSFPSLFARNGHLAKNHQDLLCRQCNRYYLSQDALQEHYRSDPNHPSCSQCEVAFPDNATLIRHTKVAHPAPLAEFLCHPCNRTFESQLELSVHYKVSGAHPLCLVCDQGLQGLSQFDEHVKIYHRDLYCDICGLGCQSENQLRGHYRNAECSLHPTCDVCGEGFRDLVAINEHISRSHEISPVESFSSFDSDSYCLKCDKAFDHVVDLHEHYRDSSFHPTCFPCGEGFLDDVAYNNHLHAIHPTPTPHYAASRELSPAVSPPRSLRSLSTSPRASGSNTTTTPRVASPFAQTTSPTFFTSRSARSTRSNTPSVSTPPVSGAQTNAPAKQTTQEYGIEVASVSPRPSSAPTPTTLSPTRLSNTEAPPTRQAKELRLRPELRMPEPACTVELLTPSVLGEDSPTYESRSSRSTPELLPTPSSLESYGTELTKSSSSPAPQEAAETCSASLFDTLPADPEEIQLNAVQLAGQFSVERAYTVSGDAIEAIDSPPRVHSPPVPVFDQISPIVTTISMEQCETRTRELHDGEPYDLRESEHSGDDSPSTATESSEDTVDVKASNSHPLRSDSTTCASRTAHFDRESRSSLDSETKMQTSGASWHCRLCMNEPHEPTVTMCGHLFCHRCIVVELSKNFQCPVCRKMMLVRLYVD